MAWVTIDDQTPRHPKQIKAGMAASWLWVCGLAYCNSQLTNGFIQADALPMLAPCSVAEARRLAERLCRANLWEKVDGGYQVHDYLTYQPSRDAVLERRARSKARARAGAHARWHRTSTDDEHAKPMLPSIAEAYAPNPTPVQHTRTEKSSDGNGAVPEQGRGKPKGHHGHFFCGTRICVPQFLWEEFDKQLGGADMVKALRWMKQLDERITASGDVIEDPLKFVREAFREALKGSKRHGYVHIEDTTLDTCMHVPHCTSSRACQTLRDLEAIKENMRHECTDSPVGRQIESAPVETGRSYSLRHPDAGSVRRT